PSWVEKLVTSETIASHTDCPLSRLAAWCRQDGGSDNGVYHCHPGGVAGRDRFVVRFRLFGTVRSDDA
ncbi:hypothetical protein QUW41_10330, partial [Slackia piriformis]|nr:hypothetical protein [Slackia piriformis]